ncbi:MAG: hypothetical protein GY874_22505 [Desulfobacteraceae bacterium]|nr:hypothetical protein [Desulfobacteraceae bacterium]
MILSYNPVIVAQRNLICAGRSPDKTDQAAMASAEAVILSQGCYESLYRMARKTCPHVFPNLDVRFDYPGKLNQIRLFRQLGLAQLQTWLFESVKDYYNRGKDIKLPVVVKFDWGGEGRTVFKAQSTRQLADVLNYAQACETTGQHGFLIQHYLPANNRSLRVTVIGHQLISYWRVQSDKSKFGTSLAQGACIETGTLPRLIAAAESATRAICNQTGLQLAGFDFIFDKTALESGHIEPLILEINFFFGRTGLGGSRRYYELLEQAVDTWLDSLNLKR